MVVDPRNRRPVMLAEADAHRARGAAGWILTLVLAAAAHGGLFWYVTREPMNDHPPTADEPAAVMIDMSPEVQQAFSQTDAAVGQPMQEAAEEPPPPPDPNPDPIPQVDSSPTDHVATLAA